MDPVKAAGVAVTRVEIVGVTVAFPASVAEHVTPLPVPMRFGALPAAGAIAKGASPVW